MLSKSLVCGTATKVRNANMATKYVIEIQLPNNMWFVYTKGENKGYFDTKTEAEIFAMENFAEQKTTVRPVTRP